MTCTAPVADTPWAGEARATPQRDGSEKRSETAYSHANPHGFDETRIVTDRIRSRSSSAACQTQGALER